MDFKFLDSILKYIPHIKKPDKPPTFRDKLKWTAAIMTVYFVLFSTPAFGVNLSTLATPELQLINIIFAARTGTLITVGIGPIVLSSIILQLLQGASLLKIDLNDPEQKGRFQTIQKSVAIIIAVVEAVLFSATGYVPLVAPQFFGIVAMQLAISAIIVIYLDEMMVKYGLTSGINLFIAGGVSYSLVSGTANILIPEAASAITAGGASALPNAILAFAPLFFSVLVMLISIYAYDIKVELPLAFSQFRRDPRIIESILNKYIPTITVLGSIFVALLAAMATLTGAVGTGMGILLTVGIMYMLYQQLERENMLEGYPQLDRLLS